MDLGRGSDADLLERALEGERVDDAEIVGLVAVARAVATMDRPGLAARPEFVADLRSRILADAGAAGGPRVEQTDRAPVSVLRLAGRPLRFAAAAVAALVVAAGTLGLASRSALPGDALYGVKQVLDRAAVDLAGSQSDEGLTHLAQAEQHIGEARELIDRGEPTSTDVDTALDAASGSTSSGQAVLLEVYRDEGRGDALTELADFYARALPQVDAMRDRVPPASRPAWQRLHDLLVAGRDGTLRELAACTVCGDAAARARAALDAPAAAGSTASVIAPATSTPAPTPTAPDGIGLTGGVTLPEGGVGLPGVGASSDSIGVGGGGVTLPGSTVNLPSLGATSSTIGAGGGGVTLPGPLPTVSLPSASLTAPDLSDPSLLP
jgi:hypothetical protein